MILIISTLNDYSTDLVIDWLNYYGYEFCRINDADTIENINIEISNEKIDFTFKVKNIFGDEKLIAYNNISSVWFRRGKLNFDLRNIKQNNKDITKYLFDSLSTLSEFIYLKLKEKYCINHIDEFRINKLHVLNEAVKVGLNIPRTKISKTPQIDGVNKNWITKEFNQVPLTISNYNLSYLTKEVKLKKHSQIGYSLFQSKIEKKYEIRSFFLEGQFYSMAMLTQENNHSKLDSRNNFDNSISMFKCKLPLVLENKLNKLLKNLGINSCSLDLIYTSLDEFIFLEINPIGQWHYLSETCGYKIEKVIAKQLCKII